jgi:VanZ family protein
MQIGSRPRIAIAAVYFIILNILFTLPGTAFPSDDWMTRIWFDKWVHTGLFFVLIILVGWAIRSDRKPWAIILISAAVYGILVEIVQHKWIPFRSFDWGDWIADITGSVLGMLAFNRAKK